MNLNDHILSNLLKRRQYKTVQDSSRGELLRINQITLL